MVCYCWFVWRFSYRKSWIRVSHYIQHEGEFCGISFPMALKDIPKFERLNNVSTSVFGYQERKEDRKGFVYPLKVSKEVND